MSKRSGVYRENAGRRGNRRRISGWDYLISAAALFFVFSLIFMISRFREEPGVYWEEERSLSYRLTDKSYASLVNSYLETYTGNEEQAPDDTREYYAVGAYCLATFEKTAAERMGLTERAAYFSGRMEEEKQKMGPLLGEADKIDAILLEAVEKEETGKGDGS